MNNFRPHSQKILDPPLIGDLLRLYVVWVKVNYNHS